MTAVAAAGLPPRSATADLARARAAAVVVGGGTACTGVLLGPTISALGGFVAVAGLIGPSWWVGRVAARRRRQIVRALPDLIDLIVLCVEAGVALEPAVRMASARLPGPLADELAMTMRHLDLGTPRREALGGLSHRMGVPELTGLIGALKQADELGTPIATTLRRQAELLRAARRQAVRAATAKAVPKVQLVVAMVMVPSALLVVLGVLVLHLFGELGVVGVGA